MASIWLINPYGMTPESGIGGRTHFLAIELAKMGHSVTVFASRSHHLLHRPYCAKEFKRSNYGYEFVDVPGPQFHSARSKNRVLNWILFPLALILQTNRALSKPDAILYSSPAPIGFLAAEFFARYFKAKLVFEVRDIWPLTLAELGGFSLRHPLLQLMGWVERRAYRKSDQVVSNLKGAVDHMIEAGMDPLKFIWIPNGTVCDSTERGEQLAPELVSKLPSDRFIIAYAGTMGRANSMETLIKTAALLKGEKIQFVLAGSGALEDDLKKSVAALELNNVTFLGKIPKAQVPDFLNYADACVILWNKSPLYRFGIAANKIFDYFKAGRPILHAYSGMHDPIKEYNAGLQVEAENAHELAEAIVKLMKMSKTERTELGKNGQRAVEQYFDYAKSAVRLRNVLLNEIVRASPHD